MNLQNVWAYTPPENIYPQFISFNENSGKLIVSIRGPKVAIGEDNEYVPGPIVAFELDVNQTIDLKNALEDYIHRNAR